MPSSWLGLVILLGLGAVALAILSEVTRKSGKKWRDVKGEDVWSERNAGPRAVNMDGPLPYRKREWILDSGSEASFYGVLEKACAEALGRPIRVMVQVPVSRLIEVEKGLPRGESQVWRNKIDRKSVDYVVCEAGSLRPLFAVELDGSSHDRADRKERDSFVERALEGAGVGLMRVDRRGKVGVEEVIAMLKGFENSPPALKGQGGAIHA